VKILGKKILIRKLEGSRKQGGLDIPKAEGDLPEAEVIAVSSELELEVSKVNIPKAGDIIYYSVPRGKSIHRDRRRIVYYRCRISSSY
jgi:co-chaperonin GroES (HSP10)